MRVPLRPAVTAAIVAVAVTMAGCGNAPAPAEPPRAAPMAPPSSTTQTSTVPLQPSGQQLPDAASEDVDLSSPEEVALAALRIIYTRDTSQEPNSSESFVRAAPLMTDKLREELVIDDSTARPSRQWSQWVEQAATIAADTEVSPEEYPADEPDLWRRSIEVVEYVHTGDGAKLGTFQSLHYVDMRREGEDWRLDQLRLGERMPA